ncbi:hypothetical protein [Methylobrevis pamukkalensis]|uniref:Uncharacterized protein n=1 Tax=Methylobrevis pamukkalensis TaxID=1439726 RepID=A0A1E3GYR2_9HYPH|nr:hypothetical protein [Methylobrevis pamukkalensis]ODN69207.1 hypothetical protein A6302_03469 [Methylobrevis pamukkalensis]
MSAAADAPVPVISEGTANAYIDSQWLLWRALGVPDWLLPRSRVAGRGQEPGIVRALFFNDRNTLMAVVQCEHGVWTSVLPASRLRPAPADEVAS